MSCSCVATSLDCIEGASCSSTSVQMQPFYGTTPDNSCEKLYNQVTCCSCESAVSSATVPFSCTDDNWQSNPIAATYVTCYSEGSCAFPFAYDEVHNMAACSSGALISISDSQYQTQYLQSNSSNPPSSNAAGAIAGIVVGCIAAIAIIVGGVLCWRRRRNRRQANAIVNDNKGG
jgi:hypothetical protein